MSERHLKFAFEHLLQFVIREADRLAEESDRAAAAHIKAERRFRAYNAKASRFDQAISTTLDKCGPVELGEYLRTRMCSTDENIRGWVSEQSPIVGKVGVNGPSVA